MSVDVDVAVIGAGPGGANAALKAGELGLSVVLIDEAPKPGGQVWRAKNGSVVSAPHTPETSAGDDLRSAVGRSNLRHLGDTRLWQVVRADRCWHLHLLNNGKTQHLTARSLVLATGAREFVQPVPGWTLPGVLGLAGATALFKQSLTLPGQNIVVSGTGPLVFFVASEVRRLGGTIAAVITPNSKADWMRALPQMAARPDLVWRGAIWVTDLIAARVPIRWRHAVTSVEGTDCATGVTYQKVDSEWAPMGAPYTAAADSVCLGNGLLPSVEAAQLAGLDIRHDAKLGGWVPKAEQDGTTALDGLYICGDGSGIRGAAAAEIHGQLAGLNVAQSFGVPNLDAEKKNLMANYKRAARFGLAMTGLSVPRAGLMRLTQPETIVCRCEGVQHKSIAVEIDAGAQSTNAVKSGKRAGMGSCGGKYCQTAIARMIAEASGKTEADVLPTTPRPPLRPLPLSALAGEFEYDDLPIPKPAPL